MMSVAGSKLWAGGNGGVMSKSEVRVAPPSSEPNNQDVFIWALYLLGGADRDVDVEEVYLKSFELAPARLGWRTQPTIPDYKKTAKALQSVEASTHVGLVHKVGPYTRRLTAAGAAWVERNKDLLVACYQGGQPVAARATATHERWRRRVRGSADFAAWGRGEGFQLADLADVLECSAASPARVWRGRIEEVRRAAEVAEDEQVRAFADAAEAFLSRKVGGWS